MADLLKWCRRGGWGKSKVSGIEMPYLYIAVVFSKWDLFSCTKKVKCGECIT